MVVYSMHYRYSRHTPTMAQEPFQSDRIMSAQDHKSSTRITPIGYQVMGWWTFDARMTHRHCNTSVKELQQVHTDLLTLPMKKKPSHEYRLYCGKGTSYINSIRTKYHYFQAFPPWRWRICFPKFVQKPTNLPLGAAWHYTSSNDTRNFPQERQQ